MSSHLNESQLAEWFAGEPAARCWIICKTAAPAKLKFTALKMRWATLRTSAQRNARRV